MNITNDVFGLVYTGEQNMDLIELCANRAIGALPVGGRYRAIDFILSNMVNSGIRNVGVITRMHYQSMVDHLGSGKEWDLSKKNGGMVILAPVVDTIDNSMAQRGLCDSIKNSMGYIKRISQQYCLLSSAYNIYNTTYTDLVNYHIAKNADITILYNDEPITPKSGEMGFNDLRLNMDKNGRVLDMEFNPIMPTSTNMSLSAYLIKKDLLEYLVDDAISRGRYKFIQDVLMSNVSRLRVYGYEHTGYVGRLHSVASYYDVNMSMLNREVQKELFHTGHPVYTKAKDEFPVRYGSEAVVQNSLIANGCEIEGRVENSVIFRTVKIGKDTTIKDSIIMNGCEIFNNCWIENTILDKNVRIRSGRRLIGDKHYPVVIKKGAVI